MAQPKHTAADLKQMQSLPLSAKIIMTKNRIRAWYEYWDGQVCISFSGGKDSTVLKHIVDSMYSDVPSVFVNTGLEYPEIQQFVRKIKAGTYECFNHDVEILRPEMRFDEVISHYGYPVISKRVAEAVEGARKNPNGVKMKQMNGTYMTNGKLSMFNYGNHKYLLDAPFKISDKCCDVMKKKPLKKYQKETNRKPFVGTMAEESTQRLVLWMKVGCNAYDAAEGSQVSKPMSFWTEQDILHYIKQFNVPYCTVYGEINVKPVGNQAEGQMNLIDYLGNYEPEDILETKLCKRTGCMYCAFGCHLEKEPNRFQRMKQTHPKQYAYCMDQLGMREVLEYIGVPYE